MRIKDIIAQVRAKISSEELEKVNGLLSEIARAEDDILADRSAANNESKSRKEKIRELESNIEELNSKLEAASKQIAEFDNEKKELIEYKTKWESEKTEREKVNLEKWNNIKAKFDIKETDPGFDKISKLKTYYHFGDELTPKQIEENLKLAKRDEDLGLFQAIVDPPPNNPKGDPPKDTKEKVFNPFVDNKVAVK